MTASTRRMRNTTSPASRRAHGAGPAFSANSEPLMLQASRSLGRLAALAALLLTANAFAYDDEKPHGFWHAEPGNIDYYVLVLGWSPTYCLHEGDARNDMQCDSEQSHDFVLHGLWPQYAEGWPEDCYTGQRPWVCLLYTSDAADDLLCVDLGGRRII